MRHNCYCPIQLSGEQACYQSDRHSYFLCRNRDEGQHSRNPDRYLPVANNPCQAGRCHLRGSSVKCHLRCHAIAGTNRGPM